MMKKAEQYRQKAAEALDKAEHSLDEKEKSFWLTVATEWQRLADADTSKGK